MSTSTWYRCGTDQCESRRGHYLSQQNYGFHRLTKHIEISRRRVSAMRRAIDISGRENISLTKPAPRSSPHVAGINILSASALACYIGNGVAGQHRREIADVPLAFADRIPLPFSAAAAVFAGGLRPRAFVDAAAKKTKAKPAQCPLTRSGFHRRRRRLRPPPASSSTLKDPKLALAFPHGSPHSSASPWNPDTHRLRPRLFDSWATNSMSALIVFLTPGRELLPLSPQGFGPMTARCATTTGSEDDLTISSALQARPNRRCHPERIRGMAEGSGGSMRSSAIGHRSCTGAAQRSKPQM